MTRREIFARVRQLTGSRAVRLLIVAISLFALFRVSGCDDPVRGIDFSSAVFARDGSILRITLARDQKIRLRESLNRISPIIQDAILLHEDRWFYWHPGINPWAIGSAVTETYLRGGRRGGSTITMHLARMLFRIDSHRPMGKIAQMIAALYLELRYSKRSILEAYLNLVPLGGNVEGIPAASLLYFGKTSANLNVGEAMTLAVIPQNPARARQGHDLTRARNRLFEHWIQANPGDHVNSPDVVLQSRELPFLAPHFTVRVLSQTESGQIHTTLDTAMQRLVERRVHQFVREESSHGIRNAAVLVVDWPRMEVRSALGSADFFDKTIQGEVDGTRAKRSPGSALKPFVYALALDQGIIHSHSLLRDTPTRYGPYNPENFEGDFVGPIFATDALIRSRNIPAVQIGSKLHPDVYSFLKSAGIRELKGRDFYGLAPILGGVEVTMEEIVELYGALANRGMKRSLRVTPDESIATDTLFSSEAAFVTLMMLRENPPPSQNWNASWIRSKLPVYWKTGTSIAFRDAWSIAIVGHYIIAVWVGNFDGKSNPAFVGREAAAPLLFQILEGIRSQEPLGDLIEMPDNVRQIEVCATYGMIPGAHCQAKMNAWFIPGKSPIQICDVHREVLIDNQGYRSCVAGSEIRTEVYEFWPSDFLRLFRAAGIPRKVPPPYAPDCRNTVRATQPSISSPDPRITYTFTDGELNEIALTCVADAGIRKVYWFVDDSLVGSGSPERPLFWNSKPGRFLVRVVDEMGGTDSRQITVKTVR